MATGTGSVERYMDVSPMQGWNKDQWDEYDKEINVAFHGTNVFLTPLCNYVAMPQGANTWYTGSELLGTHVNHNAIGARQRFVNAMYVDTRRKKLISTKRYGSKIQLHDYDELISRYGNGTPSFMLAIMRTRLANSIVGTHEKLARDAIFNWAEFKFLADGNTWTLGTNDLSNLTATSTYQFNIRQVMDMRLRLAERTSKFTQQWGDWAKPIPGMNDVMMMTTPNVMYDIWTSEEGEWMQDLRSLQDQRVINGGEARYRGMTFVSNPDLILWNLGVIDTQLAVTQAIKWGDGSPDPDSADPVDNIYLVGQSSADITHYIQLGAFVANTFTKGDRVAIHTARTDDWGITDGCDYFDGKTVTVEVYAEDAANNRIQVMEPMVESYEQSFTATPNGGAETTCYAFVTKARHIHPMLTVGARGMHTFAARKKITPYFPSDDQADLPGVVRATWDERGEMNRWNPYIYELTFCVATDTLSGRASPALR